MHSTAPILSNFYDSSISGKDNSYHREDSSSKPPVCLKIWHLSHKLQPLKCGDKLVLPEDIQGQAGAEPRILLAEAGCGGAAWGRPRRSLSRWSWARPHHHPATDCRCCAATVAPTPQSPADTADHHDVLTHCRPADARPSYCRQAQLLRSSPLRAWARVGASGKLGKCFSKS